MCGHSRDTEWAQQGHRVCGLSRDSVWDSSNCYIFLTEEWCNSFVEALLGLCAVFVWYVDSI